MKIEVTKEFTFDAGHQLVGHAGKCRNVHGHTYKLAVTVRGVPKRNPGRTDDGFVVDLGDLKKVVKEHIVEKMDHAFLAKGDEPILEVLERTECKVYLLGERTTAENIAAHIFRTLHAALRDVDKGIELVSVKLWETPTLYAEVCQR